MPPPRLPPRRTFQVWRWLVPLVTLFGCSDGMGEITVRIALPESVSTTANAQLVLTRFDVAGIADSIATAAGSTVPDFSTLERDMIAFRPQRSEALDSLRTEWMASRREIVLLADSLRTIGRDAPGYSAAYDRLRSLHRQVTARESALERRMGQLVPSGSVSLARRAVTAADSMRRWERTVLVDLPNLLDSLSKELGAPLLLPLPPDGEVHHELRTGRWWAAMRIQHPENPFLEYYWKTSFVVNRLVPIVVPLDSRHMVVRWRH